MPLSAAIYIQEPEVHAMKASDCYQAAFVEVLLCCCFYCSPVPAICSFKSVPTSCIGDTGLISSRYICSEIELPLPIVNEQFGNKLIKLLESVVLKARVLHVSI